MNYDYNEIYLNRYKKLPSYVFWGTLISTLLESILSAIAIMINVDESGLILLIIGPLFAVGFAFLAKWVVSILVSQRVVVADSLLSLVKHSETQKTVLYTQTTTSTATKEDIPDLPEL